MSQIFPNPNPPAGPKSPVVLAILQSIKDNQK